MKRLLYVLSAAFLMMSGISVYGEDLQNQTDEAGLIEDLILYYGCYGKEASSETDRLLVDLKEADAAQGELWENIMDYWEYVDTDLVINRDHLPENLPEDDSLALIILGGSLKDDGSMKDELIRRLNAGLVCAEQYPNAYVVCTGGGTAKDNKDVTEAGQMGAWLVENGLDEDRLILEDQSRSTIENSQFTLDILREDYPGIDSAAIVTSDYHVARGSLLFEAVMLMMTEDDRDPEIEIVSNCASSAPNKYYTDDYIRGWEMYNLLQLTGDRDLAMQYVLDRENFPRPVLDGQTEDDEAA